MRRVGGERGRGAGSPRAGRIATLLLVLSLGGVAPAAAQVRTVLGQVQPKPEMMAQVISPIWGRMEFPEKALTVGDAVRKGQPIARIILELSADERYGMEARNVELKSAAQVARTRKQQRELEYKRAVALLKSDPQNRIRQQQVIAAEQLFQAAAEEQELYDRQERAFQIVMQRRDPRVTIAEAPISGVIMELDVKPGQLIPTGEFRKLATIVDLSRVWIAADVHEGDLGAVVEGAKAFYSLPESPEAQPLGPPVAILPWIDEKTRTGKVIYEIANASGRLRLGMSVRVSYEATAPTAPSARAGQGS